MCYARLFVPLQTIMAIDAVTLNNGQFSHASREEQRCGISKSSTTLRQESFDVVSPSIVSAPQEESEKSRWFLMRAAYGQESKAAAWLADKEGIEEVFCPQWTKERVYAGKRKKVLVSLLPNILFVKSSQAVLRRFVGVPPMHFLHHYYEPYKDEYGRDIGNGRRPLVIPEGQMISFRKWLEADAEDKIYIQNKFHFKQNDIVRVTEGQFAGFIGHVVRLKGQTRVGVNIEGIGFVCTTYIPKYCLENLGEPSLENYERME